MDLVPIWYKDRYCTPPPPPPHTHTHTPRSYQNQGHILRNFQKQNVQYQASYPVRRQVLFFCFVLFCLLFKKSTLSGGMMFVSVAFLFFIAGSSSLFVLIFLLYRHRAAMPLFGRSQKSPQELVKALKESLTALTKETGEKKLDKVRPKLRYFLFPLTKLLQVWQYFSWRLIMKYLLGSFSPFC